MAVGEPGHTDRNHRRLGVELADETLDRVPQRRREGRARSAAALDPLEVVLPLAEHRPHLNLGLSLALPRQQPAVNDDLARRRDHVAPLGGGDHRRRERQRKDGLQHLRCDWVELARKLQGLGGLELPARDGLHERVGLRAQPQLGPVSGQTLDQPRGLDERVVGNPRHRRVSSSAVHAQPEGRAHLLRRRAEVEGAAGQLDPLAPAFVERVVGSNSLGMRLAQPRQAKALAHLLVGRRDEDQVAGRLEPFPRKRGDGDGIGRNLALHVERAATPDLTVANLSRPRVDLPLSGIRDDRVRVRKQEQARPVAPPGKSPDEVRALRYLRVQLTLDSVCSEVVPEQLRGDSLVPRRIHRVEPDQLLDEVGNLVAETSRAHRRLPSTRRYARGSATAPPASKPLQ